MPRRSSVRPPPPRPATRRPPVRRPRRRARRASTQRSSGRSAGDAAGRASSAASPASASRGWPPRSPSRAHARRRHRALRALRRGPRRAAAAVHRGVRARSSRRSGRTESAGAGRRRARPLVPELAELLPDPVPAARADPDTERSRLFDAVTRLLRRGSARRRSLLVLDDLHWAGKTTLSLLRHLLRDAEARRLLVVGTYRDTELARTHPLARRSPTSAATATAERITLGGLASDGRRRLPRGRRQRRPGPRRELAEVTSGNPFFLIEVLRHVEETGGAGSRARCPRACARRPAGGCPGCPTRPTSAVGRRGRRHDLRPRARRAGRRAASSSTRSPRPASAGLVRRGGRDGRPVPVRPRARPPGAAGRARDPQAGPPAPDDRRAARGRAASARTPTPASPTSPTTGSSARRRATPSKAVDACRRAADRAMERLAYEEAGDLYGMAAQALDAASTAPATR